MWGKGRLYALGATQRGITPTHVGKRKSKNGITLSSRDHPHPCGEKQKENGKMFILPGSPPPMWGKVIDKGEVAAAVRITPTHVGKS